MVDTSPEVLPDDRTVEALARAATGRAGAEVATWALTPSTYPVENMTTHCLARLAGTLTDGTDWSVFVKTLQPASDSPVWAFIPEQFHQEVLEDLDWLGEPRIYRSPLAARLPEGLRMPAVYAIEESPNRITIWMEDVAGHDRWDLDRYRRASVALGRLAGRWPEDRAVVELGLERRVIDRLFFGKVRNADLPALAEDAFWADPLVAAAADPALRGDLARLAEVIPALLGRLSALPHAMAHGDAAPDNLREPGDGTVVAIDWSYGNIAPVGSDLAQLLAGRAESGHLEPDELADIGEVLVAGFLRGLSDEGVEADPNEVEAAFAIHLAVRSAFSALVLDPGADRPEDRRRDLLRRRAGLARFAIDLVTQLTGST
jgi:hypothetical protein